MGKKEGFGAYLKYKEYTLLDIVEPFLLLPFLYVLQQAVFDFLGFIFSAIGFALLFVYLPLILIFIRRRHLQ